MSIPAAEVENETTRVAADVQKRAKLPGFRPGKAPTSLIRKQFAGDIRQRVLESLIPKTLQKQFEAENLNVVGTPDISDVHFHEGEPLRFKAEFEVVPTIELGEYRGVEVAYQDPEVAEEDVAKRIEELREQKAEFVNVDPRPLENGDFAVVALESISGVEGEPVKQEEMVLEIGGADTFDAFTENLLGLSPGDEKEFEVTYPENYGAGAAGRQNREVSRHRQAASARRNCPRLMTNSRRTWAITATSMSYAMPCARTFSPSGEFEAQQAAKDKIVDSAGRPARISRPRSCSSSGRSSTASSRACAPWPPTAST